MKTVKILLGVAVFLCLSTALYAAVPEKINYQGKLKESGALVTATKSMLFKIYDASTAGNLLWQSGSPAGTAASVSVTSGLFTYVLGGSSDASDLSGIDWENKTCYLEIVVAGTTLTPRELLVAVSYALSVRGLDIDASGNIVVAGSVKVADDTATCTSANAGTIRWKGTALQVCDGGAWSNVYAASDGTSQTQPGESCKQIKDDGYSTGDGTYWIDPGLGSTSDAYQVYCDMTTADGGWTLVMKHASTATTFYYASTYWTAENLLNSTDLTLNEADAKYQSFSNVSFTSIRGCVDAARTTCVSHTFGSAKASALAVFSGGYLAEGPGTSEFQTAGMNANDDGCQPNCNQRGFNNDMGTHEVRWGWGGNNEADCASVDGSAGFGMGRSSSTARSSSGQQQTHCSDHGVPKPAWIWVR